jgi:F-type H+-transporting ATPase subunit gamma
LRHDGLELVEADQGFFVFIFLECCCQRFNSQLFKKVRRDIAEFQNAGKTVKLILFGRKAVGEYKKSGLEIISRHEGNDPSNFNSNATQLTETLTTALQENEYEKALICFNQFKSVMTQTPSLEQVLPMNIDSDEQEDIQGDYIYEPTGAEILGELLPMALHTQILQAFLETEAGEQAARMQAMDNATRNAGEMIDKLTLVYNRARQAAITKELIEIISGAEAL